MSHIVLGLLYCTFSVCLVAELPDLRTGLCLFRFTTGYNHELIWNLKMLRTNRVVMITLVRYHSFCFEGSNWTIKCHQHRLTRQQTVSASLSWLLDDLTSKWYYKLDSFVGDILCMTERLLHRVIAAVENEPHMLENPPRRGRWRQLTPRQGLGMPSGSNKPLTVAAVSAANGDG